MKRKLHIRMVAPAIALMVLGTAGAFGQTQEQVDVSVTLTTDQQAVMQQAHGTD